MSVPRARYIASEHAWKIVADLCSDGCLLGIGTGSTIRLFLELSRNDASKLRILQRSCIVTSSIDTAFVLQRLDCKCIESGIPLQDLDLYIDSCDEFDERLYMIKGGGGAMLREKILASLSRNRLYILDEDKVSIRIGTKKPVPIEVVPYAYRLVINELQSRGIEFTLRYSKTRYGPTLTDNGNLILDLKTGPIEEPAILDRSLLSIPGVVVTGIFLQSHIDLAIVGHHDGTIKVFKKSGQVEIIRPC